MALPSDLAYLCSLRLFTITCIAMTYPILSAGLLILIFVCLGLVFWGLRQTTQHFTPAVQRQWLWRYSLGITSWLGVLAVLAGSGFLSQFEALPPRMPSVVLAPVVVLVLLLPGSAGCHPR